MRDGPGRDTHILIREVVSNNAAPSIGPKLHHRGLHLCIRHNTHQLSTLRSRSVNGVLAPQLKITRYFCVLFPICYLPASCFLL